MTYSDDGIVRVLVIDDDETLRSLVTHLLLGEGCQVVPVGSAEDGLAQLPYGRFDVAFVDHKLPGMEGLVFGEYLRDNNPSMQIALITGSPEPSLERAARDHNIAFIEKPFEPRQLFAVVDRSKTLAAQREREESNRAAPAFAPDVVAHAEAITSFYAMPHVPDRVSDRLSHRVRDALAALKHGGFTEELRVVALAGLLTARVLGLRLPAWSERVTLEAMYDELMLAYGRRREFTKAAGDDDDFSGRGS